MAAKLTETKRRMSTLIRYKAVQDTYNALLRELGNFAHLVPRSYIYELLQKKTGLSTRTLSRIINHG